MKLQAIPPTFEARPFEGGASSALDIQGWLLANGIESTHASDAPEGGEKIEFDGKTLNQGEWLFQQAPGKFVVMDASTLFNTYTQVL